MLISNIADQTALLYFFSALAQCAAAFVAIIGVFAVFRLQVNPSLVDQEFTKVKIWFMNEPSLSQFTNQSYDQIKERLVIITGQKSPASDTARKYLESVDAVMNFPIELERKISYPLRLWADVFLVSLMVIPFLKPIEGVLGLIACIFMTMLVIYSLLETRKIVWLCLNVSKVK